MHVHIKFRVQNFSDKLAISKIISLKILKHENYCTRKFPKLRYLFSRESFYMADRTGLDRTTLHYLAVQQAMVSVHWPVRLNITVTYAPTWQTDCWRALYILEKGFWSVTKRQGGLFLSFVQTFSALIVWINCQNGVTLKHGLVYCRLCHYGRGHDDPSMLN